MRLQIFYLVVLLAMIYHCQSVSNDEATEIEDNEEQFHVKRNRDDSDEYETSNYRSSRSHKPDEYGNINLYFREPSRDGKRRKPKRMRFPVHRFERNRFPPFPSLLSFLPWLPIFEERITKQTIIYSPAGGVYIIPPVINFIGKRYSVAQLIAAGYVSLVSSGAPPPPAVDVAPLVQPGAVTGPGVPVSDSATGGFKGGVRTEYRSFPRPKYPDVIEEDEAAPQDRKRTDNEKSGY